MNKDFGVIHRRKGIDIPFNGTLGDCDILSVGESKQLAHRKKSTNTDSTASFKLVYGDFIGPFTPQLREGTRM